MRSNSYDHDAILARVKSSPDQCIDGIIADEFGCAKQTVGNIRRAAGIKYHKERRLPPDISMILSKKREIGRQREDYLKCLQTIPKKTRRIISSFKNPFYIVQYRLMERGIRMSIEEIRRIEEVRRMEGVGG